MNLKGRHIILLFGLIIAFQTKAQKEVCTFEDGQLVFHLNSNWTKEERMEISLQFELDTLMLDLVLASPKEGQFEFEGATWTIVPEGNGIVRLSKNMDDLSGKIDWKKDILLSPNDPDMKPGHGPGYVDMESVVSGVNRLSKKVVIQYPNGKTKFILPNHKNAEEVYISGSFNGWSTSEIPLEKTGDGWEVELHLSPGKYLYKFIVDGEWMRAPGNSLVEGDGWGNYNSVFYRYNYKFALAGYADAKKVYLASSFNYWKEKDLRLTRTASGWVLPIYLKEGTYSYKFIVDGEWTTDPDNPIIRPDGGGNFNSVLSFGDTTMFRLNGYTDANEVRLAGNFNGWNPGELVMTKTAGGWELPYVLSKGNYEYKFIVDGEWMIDPRNPYVIRHGDNTNSFLAIEPNFDFNLEGFADASSVLVTGNFTGWSEENNSMVKEGSIWTFPIHLKPGKYLYKYLVDGEWITDPNNPTYEENAYGSGNSVLWMEETNMNP